VYAQHVVGTPTPSVYPLDIASTPPPPRLSLHALSLTITLFCVSRHRVSFARVVRAETTDGGAQMMDPSWMVAWRRQAPLGSSRLPPLNSSRLRSSPPTCGETCPRSWLRGAFPWCFADSREMLTGEPGSKQADKFTRGPFSCHVFSPGKRPDPPRKVGFQTSSKGFLFSQRKLVHFLLKKLGSQTSPYRVRFQIVDEMRFDFVRL
jgi:hypothetical protein